MAATTEPKVEMGRGLDALPPHDSEAELSVLGSCLIDEEAIGAIGEQLTAGDFYHPRNRDLFAAFERLHARSVPTDLVTVMEELGRSETLEAIGGMPFVAEAMNSVPTSLNVGYYAEIVHRKAVLRRLIQAAGRISALGFEDTDDLDELLAKADAELKRVTRDGTRGTGWTPAGSAIDAYLELITTAQNADAPSVGVVGTGFPDLDRILGGLYPGQLVVVAARPSIGKSALGLGLGLRVALRGLNVGMFSLEMSELEIAGRLLAAQADIDSARLREARIGIDEKRRLAAAREQLSELPFWIDDTSGLALGSLIANARRLHADHPLALLIVDYLQLVHSPGQNRVQEVGAVSRALKALAGELACPVLALAQLNRAVESRPDHRPQLSDLRDSGDIEADADVVVFIAREDRYDRDSARKGIADLIVAKQRNGPTGVCSLLFLDRTARFVDLAH